MCEGGCGGFVNYIFYECQYYCVGHADCSLTFYGYLIIFIMAMFFLWLHFYIPKTWWSI